MKLIKTGKERLRSETTCIEEENTQAAVAEQIETAKSYVNRVIKKPNVGSEPYVCTVDGGSGI